MERVSSTYMYREEAWDHDEGVGPRHGSVRRMRQAAYLGPVALGLLARRRLEAHRQPLAYLYAAAKPRNEPTDELGASNKALGGDLLMEAN